MCGFCKGRKNYISTTTHNDQFHKGTNYGEKICQAHYISQNKGKSFPFQLKVGVRNCKETNSLPLGKSLLKFLLG